MNLVLEFIPETVYKVARHYSKAKQTIPLIFIKVSGLTSIMLKNRVVQQSVFGLGLFQKFGMV